MDIIRSTFDLHKMEKGGCMNSNVTAKCEHAPKDTLYRPKIDFKKASIFVVLCVSAAIILSLSFVLLSLFFFNTTINFLSFYLRAQIIVIVIMLKKIMIWFIRIYQRYALPERRLMCCFTPSCSEYAVLALNKYGVIIGSYKAVKRILRCAPPGGVDYP